MLRPLRRSVNRPPSTRRAGLLAPLFSLSTSSGWGIGEIDAIGPMARWLDSAGQRLLQILPINEMPPGETSPYNALSAMAIDPLFIALDRMEDFAASGGRARLSAREQAVLERATSAPHVDYDAVRDVKHPALRRAFAAFRDSDWSARTHRAEALRAYIAEQAWWLDDYALFRALHAHHGERPWREWPRALSAREPAAVEHARQELAEEVLFRQYLQWIADEQWRGARQAAGNVAVFGDLPFVVSVDSADVWARQHEFRLDASAGAPPDAFSTEGQDWGLPVYRWDVMAAGNFSWLRDRARRHAALFEGYRVDHLVGFYRTYFRPHDGGVPEFTPADQDAQIALGERVLDVFREPGVDIIAEDLGLVPDFVRESLARCGVPGYRVLRWEREWRRPGHPFIDPARYPPLSVATSGTHDTEPLAVWWDTASQADRVAALAIPSVLELLGADGCARALAGSELLPPTRHALLDTLYTSGSDTVIVPIQDAFGWRDQINRPGTVGSSNWTWKLPWPVDRLRGKKEAVAIATELRALSARGGRRMS